jgi:glycosyltransferase involved in cell wall biosynthesis
LPPQTLQQVKAQYNLPEEYFLYVGSIIERKNLLNICKAYASLKDRLTIPVVVIGDGGIYKKQVQDFVEQSGLSSRVLFLSDTPTAKSSAEFQNAAVFPAIYQLAKGMLYPSVFEGFGVPVLEALWSGIPVITSNLSCLPETGGDAAYYVDPYDPAQIAEGLIQLATNDALVKTMVEKGYAHAQNFTPQKGAAAVMQVYLRLL